MSWRGPLLLVAAATFGCATEGATGNDGGLREAGAAQPWEVDPYTHSDEIFVDGSPVGYLVTYDAIPDGLVIDRAVPAGGRRVLDARFRDVGFLSPRGLLFRHADGGATESLGYHPLEDGLLAFFGGTQRVRLVPFFPPDLPKRARPSETPVEEGAEVEGYGEGDASEETGGSDSEG
jgi:hypothetical protein